MPRTALDPGLTEQQLKFVKLRSRGINTNTAARRAGYASTNTLQIENNPRVAAALKMEVEEYRRAAQISREEVVCGIKEAINQAKLVADPTAQIKGWTELAKMLGYYVPEVKRIELSLSADRIKQEFEQLSDEELLEIISRQRPAIEGQVVAAAEEEARA